MESIQSLVAQHAFASGLTLQHASLLCQSAALQHYPIGQTLFREGDEAKHFYLIHQGQVALETFVPGKGTVSIQSVSPGDALGWSWLFAPFCWHFSAVVTAPSDIIAFDAAILRRQIDENAEFGREVFRRVADVLHSRLLATRHQLLDFYGIRD